MRRPLRVLVLSQYYDPEPIPKPHEVAEGLRERGHEVTVVTGFPNYPYGRVYAGYAVRAWRREVIRGVPVLRLPLYPDHSRSSARRVVNYLSFMVSAGVLGPFLSGPADVMFVRHPPLTIGVTAVVWSRLRRLPFVYGVADLWPEAVVAAGMLRNRRVIGALERLERFVYRQAAIVAPVSAAMVDRLASKAPREKVRVLPDWADERVYRPLSPDPDLAARLGTTGRFNVVFGGQLGIVQKLDTVVEAAERLRDRPEVQFLIVGDGVEKPRLEREVERRGLSNIRFPGRFPAQDIPKVYALADALLVHLSADPVFALSIPGKVYAYLACAKPILAAAQGATADLVREAGAGLTCPPEDSAALAEAVLALLRTPPAARQEMGERGRRVFMTTYARNVVLDGLEEMLYEVVEAGRGTPTV